VGGMFLIGKVCYTMRSMVKFIVAVDEWFIGM
jgi:hypothetical protein